MWFRRSLASAWTLAILGLCWYPRSLMPAQEHGPRPFLFPHFDKAVHFGIFALFGFLGMWAIPRARTVFLLGLAVAALSELGQELPIVDRDATFLDGVADAVGAAFGIGAYTLLGRMSRKPAA